MEKGHHVTIGVLDEACKELNKRFFTFHTQKRPFIILKWAQTADGFIDTIRKEESEIQPNWITNSFSRQLVHKMRSEEQAILVGTNTVLNDNPKLNTRDWKGNNPVRVILDRSLRIPESYSVYDQSVKTIFITEKSRDNAHNLIFETIDFSNTIANQICDILYKHQLQSVIIEGGKQTLQTFIDANLWDEAYIFEGNIVFNSGIEAPILNNKKIVAKQTITTNTLTIYKKQ